MQFSGVGIKPRHIRVLKRHVTYSILIIICSFYWAKSQTSEQYFLSEFKKADPIKKVKMVASKDLSELLPVLPLIKDTLAAIKKLSYSEAKYASLKFWFDKMEAGIMGYNKNYARAILILESSLRLHASDVHDSLTALVDLKNLFFKIKNYNKAIDISHIIEANWSRKSNAVAIDYGIGKSNIYFQLGLTEKAIDERRREYKQLKSINDTNNAISYYNDIGVFYNHIENSDSAEYYLKKAKHLLDNLKYPEIKEVYYNFFKALVDGNLGLAYYNRGAIREAIPLLKRDIYYSLKSGNFESAMNSELFLVKCYLRLKDKKSARRYLDSAETLVRTEIKDLNPKLKYLLIEAEYFSAIGNFERANSSYRDYIDKNNIAIQTAHEQQQENENVTLSIEQKESELEERDNLLQLAQLKDARQKQYQVYLFSGIVILLIVVAFLIIYNRNVKKREAQLSVKNTQIGAQKQLLEQALIDKEVLIKEIHHRVKNNLQIISSMLSLQISKIDDDKTVTILRDARQRISAIALTHQMLYQKENLSNIQLGDYIEKLVRQVEFLMPSTNIELVTTIQTDGSRMTIDNAVPLGLLVNELLTNAYKHAFPQGIQGIISVKLVEDEKTFTLTVSDNGIGLPEDFDSGERKTLGIELIYILAEQLDSQLNIEQAGGTSVTLKLNKQT